MCCADLGLSLEFGCGFCRDARKKFGHLEKKKDYVIRAKAFHRKEDFIRVLLLICAFACLLENLQNQIWRIEIETLVIIWHFFCSPM